MRYIDEMRIKLLIPEDANNEIDLTFIILHKLKEDHGIELINSYPETIFNVVDEEKACRFFLIYGK